MHISATNHLQQSITININKYSHEYGFISEIQLQTKKNEHAETSFESSSESIKIQ